MSGLLPVGSDKKAYSTQKPLRKDEPSSAKPKPAADRPNGESSPPIIQLATPRTIGIVDIYDVLNEEARFDIEASIDGDYDLEVFSSLGLRIEGMHRLETRIKAMLDKGEPLPQSEEAWIDLLEDCDVTFDRRPEEAFQQVSREHVRALAIRLMRAPDALIQIENEYEIIDKLANERGGSYCDTGSFSYDRKLEYMTRTRLAQLFEIPENDVIFEVKTREAEDGSLYYLVQIPTYDPVTGEEIIQELRIPAVTTDIVQMNELMDGMLDELEAMGAEQLRNPDGSINFDKLQKFISGLDPAKASRGFFLNKTVIQGRRQLTIYIQRGGNKPEEEQKAAGLLRRSGPITAFMTVALKGYSIETNNAALEAEVNKMALEDAETIKSFATIALDKGLITNQEALSLLQDCNILYSLPNIHLLSDLSGAAASGSQSDYNSTQSDLQTILALASVFDMFSENNAITQERFAEIAEMNKQIEEKYDKLLQERKDLENKMAAAKQSTSALKQMLISKLQSGTSINPAEVQALQESILEEFSSILEILMA